MSKVKFVQIAYGESMCESTSGYGLYALDSEGRLWKVGESGWEQVELPDEPTDASV